MEKLGDVFHVTDFVREELYDRFIPSHLAESCQDAEGVGDGKVNMVVRFSHCFADIELKKLHDGLDQRFQKRV